MSKRTVQKCVCHRVKFEDIYAIVIEQNIDSIDDLIDQKICGAGCGMCHPYVQKMLVTGETSFAPGDVYIHAEAG
jgi:bacterioferritin-associated ferredoxin